MTIQNYPAINRILQVRLNDNSVAFDLSFKADGTMSFKDVNGAFGGLEDTVNYTVKPLAEGIFMLYWSEPKSGANVVHIHNFNSNEIYSNISMPDQTFYNLHGTLAIK